MRYNFFKIPTDDGHEPAEELNKLLSNTRVLRMKEKLVVEPNGSYWAVCVITQDGKKGKSQNKAPKIDYKEVLSAEDFVIFDQLRGIRRDISAQDGLQLYQIFNNAQLAAMVTERVKTLSAMQKIAGIGEKLAQKYGTPFLNHLQQTFKDETPPADT